MSPVERLELVAPGLLARELEYVLGARGRLARAYRAVRAAWRCGWALR